MDRRVLNLPAWAVPGRRQVVGITVGMLVFVTPGILDWEEPHLASPRVWLAIALLGGALAGRIVVPAGERMRAHLVVMVSAALSCAGAFWVTHWWFEGRESASNAEMAGTSIVGALLPAILGILGYLRVRRSELPQATARVRE
jgi:hypothetical protein